METEDLNTLCFPREYGGLSVEVLGSQTRCQLARFLDRDGPMLVVSDGPCTGQDVVTNFNGLGELINLPFDKLREISVSNST